MYEVVGYKGNIEEKEQSRFDNDQIMDGNLCPSTKEANLGTMFQEPRR